MRRAAKVDANHAAIVAAFRQLGYSVLDLSRVGQGCPDLLVARAGKTMLIEVKDGAKKPSARKLTPAQMEFIQHWRGRIDVVQSTEDVVRIVASA